MLISQSLQNPFILFNERLGQTCSSIQKLSVLGKMREIATRIGLVAIFIFAEIVLGIPWTLGKLFAYFSPADRRSTEPSPGQLNPNEKDPVKKRSIPGLWKTIGSDAWQVVYSFLNFRQQHFLGTALSHEFIKPKHIFHSLKEFNYFFCYNGDNFLEGYIKRSSGDWSKVIRQISRGERYRLPSGEIRSVYHQVPENDWILLGSEHYHVTFFLDTSNTQTAYKRSFREEWLTLPEKIHNSLTTKLLSNWIPGQLEKTQFSAQEFEQALSKTNWFPAIG
jgi:hypothetical protein